MAELLEERPGRVLAIYAHPDDPEVSCGGTLARWTAAGAEVHLVICAQGEKGSADPRTDPGVLAATRSREVAAAAKVLGLKKFHLLDRPDGEVNNDVALRTELVGLIRRLRPEVIVAPDPTAVYFGGRYVNHHDHRELGWAVLDAVAPAAASPLYFPETGAAHRVSTVLLSGSLEADVWVDITDVVDTKAKAVLCHQSQLEGPPELVRDVIRRRAEEVGAQGGVAYGESFRRLRLAE
jgi:LmbE family N-acetylglucosaminyl deacetylase